MISGDQTRALRIGGSVARRDRSAALEKIGIRDLRDDTMFRCFRAGTKAVCLEGDERVSRLWNALLPVPGQNEAGDRRAFWENGPLTLAHNHIDGRTDLGDVLRFAPGQYGHVARKWLTFPDPRTGRMRLIPERMHDSGGVTAYDEQTLRLAWDLAGDVYRSALPTGFAPGDHAVTIQLLKYPDSARELRLLFSLLGDSGGPWTRLGQRLDEARSAARGPFNHRYLRDLFGVVSLLPRGRSLMDRLNACFARDVRDAVGQDELIVGPAHVDASRSLTMLASDRDAVKTEVFDGETWTELALTPGSLAVLPGSAYEPSLSIPATVHRYSIRRSEPASSSRRLNVTLLLGIVSRESALRGVIRAEQASAAPARSLS